MYKVLLVDDDSLIRIKVKNYIIWSKLSCEIIAEASNGKEALACIEKYHPQIIITDIAMPGMDGIQLIDYVRASSPSIVIIAISAYDDFDYVRDSLKLGAVDYLLKHQITIKRFEEVMKEAISKAVDEKTTADCSSSGQRKAVLLGEDSPEKDAYIRVLYREHPEYRHTQIMMALGAFDDVDYARSMEEQRLQYLETMISETVAFYDWPILTLAYKKKMVLLFFIKDGDKFFPEEILEQVHSNVRRFTGRACSFVVSGRYEEIHETFHKYRELNQMLDKLRGQGKRGTIQYQKKEKTDRCTNALVNACTEYIVQNYAKTLSLKDVAAEFSVSSAYLSRVFKKYTGKTIVTYINEQKMIRAKELIEQGEMPMKEIAIVTGFSNYNYFYSLFREMYGYSPSEILRRSEGNQK